MVTEEELSEPPEFSWSGDEGESEDEGGAECESCTGLVVGSRGLKRRLFSVPYFSPPRRLKRALENARERGVEVDLLVPEFTDVPIADWIRERLLPEFLEMGLTIRE
jgi:hypothetical protein